LLQRAALPMSHESPFSSPILLSASNYLTHGD
jgi:hypothetical protein